MKSLYSLFLYELLLSCRPKWKPVVYFSILSANGFKKSILKPNASSLINKNVKCNFTSLSATGSLKLLLLNFL
jgi:hypothetical protein